MISMTIEEVARAVSGRLLWSAGSPAAEEDTAELVSGVSVDSRTTAPGDLFFAIPGEKFDGHHFVATAFARGAVGAVVHASRLPPGFQASAAAYPRRPLIAVQDVLLALGELAATVRQRQALRVIGITGSVGKTTTKDLTASVLAQ